MSIFETERWYEKYLPPGVTKDDLTEHEVNELIEIFSKTEIEAEQYFNKEVKDAFYEALKGSIADEIEPLLPKSPVTIKWDDLEDEHREEVKRIYFEDVKKELTEKTMRKHLRDYLQDMIE